MTGNELETLYRIRYEAALTSLASELQAYLAELFDGWPRIDRITARPKSIVSFFEKAQKIENGSPKYSEPLAQIQDQIGGRIVTFYLSDVEAISRRVEEYFGSIEVRRVIPDLPSEFGYEGKHFILFIPQDLKSGLPEEECPVFFELQIKTLFQHAWGEANHNLFYKPVVGITREHRRQLAFTAAQAWGADWIFNQLANELIKPREV